MNCRRLVSLLAVGALVLWAVPAPAAAATAPAAAGEASVNGPCEWEAHWGDQAGRSDGIVTNFIEDYMEKSCRNSGELTKAGAAGHAGGNGNDGLEHLGADDD